MILLLSLSFKNTPQKVREYFAFGDEDKKKLLLTLCSEEPIDEAAVLVTCNRTEIYISTHEENTNALISLIVKKCEDIIGTDIEHLRDYILCYTGRGAVSHLYMVSAGLDSMLIGEDQILGQVKDAIEFARKCNTSHLYLNTLFRDAVTEAKKIKTETLISKSGVSTATLALRVAKGELSGFEGKNLLIIGASGKIGSIVLKNALSYDFSQIYVTKRSHNIDMSPNAEGKVRIIEYNDRYKYVDDADIIISSTSGPHFTLTMEHIKNNLSKACKKVFVDLAVPCDIDERIRSLEGISYYNMDDMKKYAKENNEKKKMSIEKASEMAKDGVEKFLKWEEDFEYNLYKIPRPDKVIYLHLSVEDSQKLIKDRKNKIDGNEEKDIHEQDLGFLKDAYNMAEELAHKNDWIRIECLDENKNMRTIEDISDEIYNNVIGE